MFGFLKKVSPTEKLQKKYDEAISEAYRLSKTNRSASDAKQAEAQEILSELELLRKATNS